MSGGNSLLHRYRVHQGSLTNTAAGWAGLSLITIRVVEVDAVQVVLRPRCVREASSRWLPPARAQDGVFAAEVAKVFTVFCALTV